MNYTINFTINYTKKFHSEKKKEFRIVKNLTKNPHTM